GQSSGDGVGGAAPGREIGSGLGPASQAGPEARLLRRGGSREESHILGARRPRRADRSAIDSCGLHAGEEPPIEARVARTDDPVAGFVVKIHGGNLSAQDAQVWRFSDVLNTWAGFYVHVRKPPDGVAIADMLHH